MNSYPARSKQWFRVIAAGAVILTGFAGGQVAADIAHLQAPIWLSCENDSSAVEAYDEQGVVYCDDARALEAEHAAAQEAQGWPNFDSTSLGETARTADAAPLPAYGHTANGRSIALIESEEAPVVIAEEQPLPDFALTATGRSILLVESKEAPVVIAEERSSPIVIAGASRHPF